MQTPMADASEMETETTEKVSKDRPKKAAAGTDVDESASQKKGVITHAMLMALTQQVRSCRPPVVKPGRRLT